MPTRYGYYDEKGNFIKTSNVATAFWPQPRARRWICNNGHTMYLFPLDKQKPAEYWECSCKKITFEQRDQCWNEVIELVRKEYQLDTLEYIKKDRWLTIVSNIWQGRDRLDSQRKSISQTEHQEIEDEVLYQLKKKLNVSIDDLEVYFTE